MYILHTYTCSYYLVMYIPHTYTCSSYLVNDKWSCIYCTLTHFYPVWSCIYCTLTHFYLIWSCIYCILTHVHLIWVGCHTVAKKPVNHASLNVQVKPKNHTNEHFLKMLYPAHLMHNEHAKPGKVNCLLNFK